MVNLTGLAGSSNTTGDEQKKLDVIANDLFIDIMRSCGRVAVLVSEEEDDTIIFSDSKGARYAIACDPIDGSSNLDAGVSVGTIFGIHKLPDGSSGTKEDILKPGTELLASGFTMYGASSQLVITMKDSTVNGFTLDNGVGEFILTHPNMRMPKSRAIYSVNEGNSLYWEDPTKNYFNSLKEPQEDGKPYSSRYIGSMVADAYRTLLYGGIFAYPADKKSPKGKLRILYECAPMAQVFENGKSALFIPPPFGSSRDFPLFFFVAAWMNIIANSCLYSWWSGRGQHHEENARGGAATHPRPLRYLPRQLRRSGKGQKVLQIGDAFMRKRRLEQKKKNRNSIMNKAFFMMKLFLCPRTAYLPGAVVRRRLTNLGKGNAGKDTLGQETNFTSGPMLAGVILRWL